MKINVIINEKMEETTVTIETPKMTTEVSVLIENLENTTTNQVMLSGKHDDKMFFIAPFDVDILRMEEGKVVVYDKHGKSFILAKTLQEIFAVMPPDFIRISKSAIVNLSRIDHISNSFSGTMYIKMKNGIDDYISRKYFIEFKAHLGI